MSTPARAGAVLFTSGQHLAPMTVELAYAISKGAIHQMTATLADALADRGITVNAVNPGPTDTGWASAELTESVGRALPRGRWNSPEEAAAVVAGWLPTRPRASTGRRRDQRDGGSSATDPTGSGADFRRRPSVPPAAVRHAELVCSTCSGGDGVAGRDVEWSRAC